MRLYRFAAIAAVLAATIAAFFAADSAKAAVAAVTVTKNATYGDILTDGNGRALYLFFRDERNVSNCSGACLTSWPPLMTDDTPTAGAGATVARLGTITRPEGKQATYNGWPLYYRNDDVAPGDTKGQAVGSIWWVLSPFGGPVQNAALIKSTAPVQLGAYLTDTSGRSLYLYTRDEPNKTNCTGGCALTWPPVLTTDAPKADGAVDAAKLGTITRPEGGKQVTYAGRPLYYFANDVKAGDLKGQLFGQTWNLLALDGSPVSKFANAGPFSASVSVTSTGGGSVTTPDSWGSVTLGLGIVASDTTVRLTSLGIRQVPASRRATFPLNAGTRALNFEVADASGKALAAERTEMEATVCIAYTSDDVKASYGGIFALQLLVYSPSNNDWTSLNPSVDLLKGQVCGVTRRHGVIMLAGGVKS